MENTKKSWNYFIKKLSGLTLACKHMLAKSMLFSKCLAKDALIAMDKTNMDKTLAKSNLYLPMAPCRDANLG
jgi:hypothetical protein